MRRFRFKVPGDDGRPLNFPATTGGPYWTTGYSDTHAIVVAFAPDEATLTAPENWPDAEDIDDMGEMEVTFSDRFPRPEWWPAPE